MKTKIDAVAVLHKIAELNPANPDHHAGAVLMARDFIATYEAMTYTVDGEVMSPLEYIDYLHTKLTERAAIQPAGRTAKQQFDELMGDGAEPSALERLRFFCSLAMNGQDWLDVEPLFNNLAAPISEATAKPESSGCRMTGGVCACKSGGSFGGCAKERADCCTNEPAQQKAKAEQARKDGWDEANKNHCDMLRDNRHYRERVFNDLVALDVAEGLHRFTRFFAAPSSEASAGPAPGVVLNRSISSLPLPTFPTAPSGSIGELPPAELVAELRRWAGDVENYASIMFRKAADEIDRLAARTPAIAGRIEADEEFLKLFHRYDNPLNPVDKANTFLLIVARIDTIIQGASKP
jgi:hypothetical protein